MIKLLILVAVLAYGWKSLSGRWPWEPKAGLRTQQATKARRLLGVSTGASREDIIEAHKRLVAQVHPDRGGSNSSVHEANDARDVLLAELPSSTSGA